MKASSARLLARNILHLGVGQVASTALGILLTALLVRSLEPAQFGTLYTVFAIGAFAYVFIDWGQGTYLVREMARGRSDEPKFIGGALAFRTLTTALTTVGVISIVYALGYKGELVGLLFVALLVGVPASMFVPFASSFRSRDRMDLDAMSNNVGKACAVAATAVALQIGGLFEVILAQGVGGLATLLIGIVAARRLSIAVSSPDTATLRELMRNGAPLAAFSLVLATQPFVEVLLLSTLAGAAVVGWYGASRTIMGIISSPAIIALGAAYPQLARAAHSLPELRQVIELTGRVLFVASALTGAGLYVFADHIVAIIYGQARVEQTAAILRVNAIFVPLLFFVLLLASAMTAVGRNKAMVVISLVRVAICVALSWLLIEYWQQRFGNGAVALVIIAGLAEIPAVVTCLILLPRGSIGMATMLNFMRSCLTALLVAWPLSMLQPASLFVLTPLFGVWFIVVAMATRLVGPSDVSLAMDFVRTRGRAPPPDEPGVEAKP